MAIATATKKKITTISVWWPKNRCSKTKTKALYCCANWTGNNRVGFTPGQVYSPHNCKNTGPNSQQQQSSREYLSFGWYEGLLKGWRAEDLLAVSNIDPRQNNAERRLVYWVHQSDQDAEMWTTLHAVHLCCIVLYCVVLFIRRRKAMQTQHGDNQAVQSYLGSKAIQMHSLLITSMYMGQKGVL